MAENKKVFKIKKFYKQRNMTFGLLIFLIIFLYLASVIASYVSHKHVSIYEVREGSILKNVTYTGVAIRNEEIIPADANGYINYFISEESKVGKKTDVYTLSPEKLDFTVTEEEGNEENKEVLDSEEQSKILFKLQSFQESYKNSRFSDTYLVKDSIEDIMSGKSTLSRQAQLQTMLDAGTDDLDIYPAAKDGIIVFSTDGCEGLTRENLTQDIFSKNGYVKTELKNNTEVKAGDPVYKLIRDENWTLAIELQPEMAEQLKDHNYVRVKFSKDHQEDWANFSIEKRGDTYVGFLDFSDSVVRYANDRYLSVELILEDVNGLKIPKTAAVEKEFYSVPQDYITQGGDSQQSGVLVQNKKGDVSFVPVTIIDRDDEKGLVFLDPYELKKGVYLVKEESEEIMPLKKTKKIKGVYNLNKGYASFRKIDVLSESDEYYIISTGSAYGVSNYDHIALTGKSIEEDEVIF